MAEDLHFWSCAEADWQKVRAEARKRGQLPVEWVRDAVLQRLEREAAQQRLLDDTLRT